MWDEDIWKTLGQDFKIINSLTPAHLALGKIPSEWSMNGVQMHLRSCFQPFRQQLGPRVGVKIFMHAKKLGNTEKRVLIKIICVG